jgi:hypothetical protein
MENKKELQENQESSQTVKEQLQIVQIKGVLIGTITLKTPFKDVLTLMQKPEASSSFCVTKEQERVYPFELLRLDENEFPLSVWIFPDVDTIKRGIYQDLPF